MKKKVLIVDDDRVFSSITRKKLSKYSDSFLVLTAHDGRHAVEKLSKNTISLVVTDLEMPNMDGFELAEKVKSDSRFAHLPIIALTSLADDEDIEKGTQMGIDDYQIKLDREKLIEAVRIRLGK